MFLPLYVEHPYYRKPWATLGLIVVNVLAFVAMGAMSDNLLLFLLCWPDQFAPWQWVTAVFLHADIFHLSGNLLFLWVFGRYVEERLGPARFLALYLALGVVSSLAYIVTQIVSGSGIPSLGASGAISGLMGVAIVAGTGARVLTLLWFYPVVRVVPVPAGVILGFWALEQILLAAIGTPGIAFSAHLGGFAAGVLAAWVCARPSIRHSLWYLDPAESSRESRKLRSEEAMWGAIAEYHAGDRRRPTVTPGWQPPQALKPDTLDPYEDEVIRRWNERR